MERLASSDLQSWWKKSKRKPLVIRGARQVGKSTLVRNFCRAQKIHLYEINLEKHPGLESTFATLDLEKIKHALEGVLRSRIRSEKSLLFLDEIQATPKALAALRYFYEEWPELAVVAAGSLLEFALQKHNFSMPVGRIQYLHLVPMTFEEFLMALGEDFLLEKLRSVSPEDAIAETTHLTLCDLQRQFLAIGGMPEAVQVYCDTKSHQEVGEIHASINETYRDDFSKYAKQTELIHLQRVYQQVPALIGQKVKYSQLANELQARDVRRVLEMFRNAKLLHHIHHSSCSGLPLGANANPNIYKLYHLDVGLLMSLQGINHQTLSSFNERKLINEGVLAEQFIAQHLVNVRAQSQNLVYWLREGKRGNAEIDFVVAERGEVIPIEVKSGKSGSLKSLHTFVLEKSKTLAIRFDLNPMSLQLVSVRTSSSSGTVPVNYTLLSLPLYCVGQISRMVSSLDRA